MKIAVLLLLLVASSSTTRAWITTTRTTTSSSQLQAQVGIFYGTSTGSTMTVAEALYEAFGSDVAAEPVDIETLDKGTVAAALASHDALVVGTPTWNTGADTEVRSLRAKLVWAFLPSCDDCQSKSHKHVTFVETCVCVCACVCACVRLKTAFRYRMG